MQLDRVNRGRLDMRHAVRVGAWLNVWTALTLTILCMLSPTLSADELADPTLGLKLEGGYLSRPQPAGYARAELSYLLTHALIPHASWTSAGSSSGLTHSWGLGLRGQLDVFHYVPWLGLTSSGELSAPLSAAQHGLELGADRKLSEEQALSLSLRLPGLLYGEGGWGLGLSWRYDWLLFDPFDD